MKMNEVKIVKFVTGEMVVAEVELQESEYILKNPICIIPTEQGAGMMPFSPFGKGEKVVVKAEHVLFTDDPEDKIKNHFNAEFGSGIVLATGFDVVNPKKH